MSKLEKSGMKALVLWVVLLLLTSVALSARSGEKESKKTALLLARTCVAEIGFELNATVDECELMWSINFHNALRKKRSLTRQTMLFNSYWKSKTQRRRRPWIQFLDGQTKPKYWPNSIKWSRYMDKWLQYRERALIFVLRPYDPTRICEGAMDYGARDEMPEMLGIELVKCLSIRTRQNYWRKQK